MPQPHQPRALPHVLLALCVATACTTPTATTPDATAEADAAPEVLADVAAPDVAAVDVADVADAVDVEADVSVAGLVVQSSEATLVPPPLTVAFSATKDGVDLSAECSWTVGPASVCVLADASHVRKVADGTCVVTCVLASGEMASKELVAKAQTVIYVVGESLKAPEILYVSRFRVTDNMWDPKVAVMPETKMFPAIGIWKNQLFIVAGADIFGTGTPTGTNPVPASAIECPEIAYNGGTDGGCRTVRALNLETGTWATAGKLPTAWGAESTVQIGANLFLAGTTNFYGDKSRLHRYNLETHEWTDLAPFVPGQVTYRLAAWKSGFMAFGPDAGSGPWEVDSTGTIWTPMTLPAWTFPSFPVILASGWPGAAAELFLLIDSDGKSDPHVLPGGCEKTAAPDPYCTFARYDGSIWSLLSAPPMLISYGEPIAWSTPNELLLMAKFTCDVGNGDNIAWRLDANGTSWAEIPAPQPCRDRPAFASTIQ